ncbi:hypothetical protein [Kitasatospora sp. NPDC059327]|uniref:hypothetical protein n=1 Tax=Kitasatospora sp. NPDC059327 TaxID=3346803 RepID=UPI0036CC01CB
MSQPHLTNRPTAPSRGAPAGSYPPYQHQPPYGYDAPSDHYPVDRTDGPAPSPADRRDRPPVPRPRAEAPTSARSSAAAGGDRGRRRAARKPLLLNGYLGYITTFVGAGLISGAVVHYPLDPARYGLIGIIAAAVFLFGTLMNEFVLAHNRPGAARIAAVVAASLALSFGIGMLSGGLQHFDDFPDRGAWLIPTGLVLSFIAYVLRYDAARWRGIIRLTGAAVAITAAVAFFGLRGLAADLTAESAGGGGHGHGAGESADSPAEHAPSPSTDAATTPGGSGPTARPSATTPPGGATSARPSDSHKH